MNIKDFLKSIIRRNIIYVKLLRPLRMWYRILRLYLYDYKRYIKYSGIVETKNSILARIIMHYHVVEKGLTMPDRHLGFGVDNLKELIALLDKFSEKYDTSEFHFKHAVSVIAEYKELHDENNYKIDDNLNASILRILKDYGLGPSRQLEMTREKYWGKSFADFREFALSRHSVRHLCGTITERQIEDAVELANSAPSACNRQPCRVHCISDKELIRKCLDLQNGNRGFGHLADKLLIVTADLGSSFENEQLDVRTNAGIYIMNLCYSLHYYKIAHCLLNWFTPPQSDLALRKLLQLPNNETVIIFIVCGDVPENFRIAVSPKNHFEKTLIMH